MTETITINVNNIIAQAKAEEDAAIVAWLERIVVDMNRMGTAKEAEVVRVVVARITLGIERLDHRPIC